MGIGKYTEFLENPTNSSESEIVERSKKYGDSLVDTYQHGKNTVEEREVAQEQAFAALKEKVKEGIVHPEEFREHMNRQFGIESVEIKENEEVVVKVLEEIDGFVGEGVLDVEDAETIKDEVKLFTTLYTRAFPEVSKQDLFEIVRDNTHKVMYQHFVDKEVFMGSDHGVQHILRGNMRLAEKLIASLDEVGVKVSVMNRLLVHQVLIDHDIGYTSSLARSKYGRSAAKDHPLYSALIVDNEKEVYEKRFGKEGFRVIREAVLNHSYPKDAFENNNEDGIDLPLIRSITGIVDSLGVTAETKVPAFFKEPEAIRALLKLRVALEVSEKEDREGDPQLKQEDLDIFKAELIKIAESETNPEKQTAFTSAVENFMSLFIAERTLAEYAGVVDTLSVERRDGKLLPKVTMRLSKIDSLLGNMFGTPLEIKAFTQAMEDFGIEQKNFTDFGLLLDKRRHKGEGGEPIEYQSDRMIFNFIGTDSTDPRYEYSDILKVFEEVSEISIRSEVREFISNYNDQNEMARSAFVESIHNKVSPEELIELNGILDELYTTKDSNVLKKIRTFVTAKEKQFLGRE